MAVPDIRALCYTELDEIRQAVSGVRTEEIDRLRDMLLNANAIAVHGVGREGLVLRSFVMRLFHLGLPASFVGDITTGPIGPGGMLFASAGPGKLATVEAVINVARGAGAHTALITGRPDAPLAARVDLVVELPAQTMAGSRGSSSSQPMGSVYEQAMWILLDAVVSQLMAETGRQASEMAARHANLE